MSRTETFSVFLFKKYFFFFDLNHKISSSSSSWSCRLKPKAKLKYECKGRRNLCVCVCVCVLTVNSQPYGFAGQTPLSLSHTHTHNFSRRLGGQQCVFVRACGREGTQFQVEICKEKTCASFSSLAAKFVASLFSYNLYHSGFTAKKRS